jgi:alpha-maltose-1-phosphate synthase
MTSPKISLVHPTSNPNSRNAAIALAEQGLLSEIITTTAYNPSGFLSSHLKFLPQPFQSFLRLELERRTWVPPTKTTLQSHPWQELLRIALLKTKLNDSFGFSRQGPIDWVYTSLDRHVAQQHLQGLSAIYAYEDGAATTFETAKQQGILCLYDLPILFYRMAREIQQQEAELFPELASSLQATQEPDWKLKRKDREIELADHIFVASSITQQSLLKEGIVPERISVIPYGAPTSYFHPQPKIDSKFRALFVGRVGPRKGIHYLLQAWNALNLQQAELMLVGVNELPSHYKMPEGVTYLPSVPHVHLNQYYSQASVFVFPSLVEGFGLVLLEAMACGIPVITTPNTAGPDILTHGVEGFIVPIRDSEALQKQLEWCYTHSSELAEMGQAARLKAEQLTWSKYRHTLANQVQSLIG